MGVLKKSLPKDILFRAQKFYGADFSKVTWRIDESPRTLNTCALAQKNEIVITADVLAKSKLEYTQILIHELAHVLQQQPQPKTVKPNKRHSNFDGSIEQSEHALEIEAQLATQNFIEGYKQLPFKLTPRNLMRCNPQTYVEIGGVPLSSENEISQKHKIVMGLIKGGYEWLRWAIQLQNQTFNFNNEIHMLDAMQIGLHGTELVLMDPLDLLAIPGRISELDENEIKLLINCNPQDTNIFNLKSKIGQVLVENNLYPKLYFDSGIDFLKQIGIAEEGIFQAMNIRQLSALYELDKFCSSNTYLTLPKRKEASEFALSHSSSPEEFIDLFRFYIWFLGKLNKKINFNNDQRLQLAQSLLQQFSDAIYPYQNCLEVSAKPSEQELKDLLQSYILSDGKLGFTRLSLAASETMRECSDSIIETIGEGFTTASEFFNDAQSFISRCQYEFSIPSQDGMTWRYGAATPTEAATIELDANGYITLGSYHQQITINN